MKFEDEIKEIRTMLNEAKKSEKQKSIKVTDYFDVEIGRASCRERV